MAHEFSPVVHAQAGRLLQVILPDAASDLTLADFSRVVVENGVYVLDPITELELSLVEVDGTNAPGIYSLQIRPRSSGTVDLRLVRAGVQYEYTIQVAETATADAALEGDYVVTVDDGGGPIPGVTVRVFDAAGTRLVQRGTTDALGQVTFYGLLVGNYQVRFSKDGVDFSAINPSTITVVPNANEAPVLDEVLPYSASTGDVLVLTGRFFDPDDTQVRFGAEATVTADHVNAAGTLLLVTVPALTGTVFALRADKEDPTAPPARLLSNSLTWQRV